MQLQQQYFKFNAGSLDALLPLVNSDTTSFVPVLGLNYIPCNLPTLYSQS